MKKAWILPDLSVKIADIDKPVPGKGEVLIKVAYAATNPKDTKFTPRGIITENGEDMAGIIDKVGEGVFEFKEGDRVAAMHNIGQSGVAFAEYGIAPASTTFHLPENISFEEGATVPLAALTAAIALYHNFKLPVPWQGSTARKPLIIYGGSSAIGAFALKFAMRSNIHPLIVVAGKSREFVETLIDRSQGDIIVDYRDNDDTVIRNIRNAIDSANNGPAFYAFDAVSESSSFMALAKVLDPEGHITVVVPWNDYSSLPKSLKVSLTWVSSVHTDLFPLEVPKGINCKADGNARDFGFIFSRLIGSGLQEGWLSPHPFEIIPGGLGGIATGLANLHAGKANAVKYIYRISDTENL